MKCSQMAHVAAKNFDLELWYLCFTPVRVRLPYPITRSLSPCTWYNAHPKPLAEASVCKMKSWSKFRKARTGCDAICLKRVSRLAWCTLVHLISCFDWRVRRISHRISYRGLTNWLKFDIDLQEKPTNCVVLWY